MNVNSGTQLDFLEIPASSIHAFRSRPRLLIELNYRTWLRFLSEEWLFPQDAESILLGVDCAIGNQPAAGLMTVSVSFDPAKLPPKNVMAWRDQSWSVATLNELAFSDTVISWDGPLPLFAVDHFTVDSLQTRAHLLGMVRGFADIELPSQPMEVGVIERIPVLPGNAPACDAICYPMNWDALRGAASMALLTVPAIAPWLRILCDSFSIVKRHESEGAIEEPWLRTAPWSMNRPSPNDYPPLWCAMMDEFSRPGVLKDWKPRLLLEAVCARARSLGDSDEYLDQLADSTMLLLKDRGTIETAGRKADLLGLVFQLVLLRPRPERFTAWKEDWPAIPPGAWWTGAMLSGYLSGFRALPLNLRGSFEARKHVAIRTLQIAGGNDVMQWDALNDAPIEWSVEQESVVLSAGPDVLATHKFSNRGRWYQLDLSNPAYLTEATALAARFCPERLRPTLVMDEGEFQLLGNGRAKLDVKKKLLTIKGALEIALGPYMRVENKLDVKNFRDWLASASMSHLLPRPPVTADEQSDIGGSKAVMAVAQAKEPKKRAAAKSTSTRNQLSAENPPEGLTIAAEFITFDEEASLIESIDALPWDSRMSRRVQHHGWNYDYKARKVDPAAYLGPLPDWANLLGERLLSCGFLSELPDQVIVNEYIGAQGITKHIDCPSCFRGAVVTISLNESWEMVFSRKNSLGEEEKFKALLARRSAAVLDGEARSRWQHEIPKRLTEGGVPRGRRVSITFRKVDTKR